MIGWRGQDLTHFDVTAAGQNLIEQAWRQVTTVHSPPGSGSTTTTRHTLYRVLHTLETATTEQRL